MLTPDKRDHYRLADHIHVRYRLVSGADLDTDPAGYFSTAGAIETVKELYRLDLEAKDSLRKIALKDKALGDFLANLNRQVKLLGQTALLHEGEPTSFNSPAMISQGGISFVGEELLPRGSYLAIRLLFRDSLLALMAFAEVRHCRLAEQAERYIIGTRFIDLPHEDEQLIQRYIIHRQAEDRRKRPGSTQP